MSASRAPRARRIRNRITAIIATVLFGAGLFYTTQDAFADEFVQYYAVGSSAETLDGIAQKFLGDSSRSTEIFNLNTGRRQPDKAALGNDRALHEGWYLVLPWDAVGPGVQYGPLPTKAPAVKSGSGSTGGGSTGGGSTGGGSTGGGSSNGGSTTGGNSTTGQPNSAAGGPKTTTDGGKNTDTASGQAVNPGDPNGPQLPKSGPGSLPTTLPPAPSRNCVTATAASHPSNWGMSKLGPDKVWKSSRGTGQLVAVVDSGVDGRAAQLSGRVAIGANIVTGDGRGDTDCLGTGTAMAGLVAAESKGKLTFAGVAPEAVVMPVRVVTDGKSAEPTDQAAAIEVAASAGVTVIALGSYVDITDAAVASAVQTALDHNIVVVAGAPVAGKAAGSAKTPDGVLMVGGISEDGKSAANYSPDTVDVVAPGVNVSSIGSNGNKAFVGSGTQYAVALTAGAAALIRASHPELTAQQVAHRLTVTSDKMKNETFGHGMINLVSGVTKELPEEVTQASPKLNRPTPGGDGVRIAFLITVLAGLVLSTMLVFRFRRTMRKAADGDDGLDEAWPADVKDTRTPQPSGA